MTDKLIKLINKVTVQLILGWVIVYGWVNNPGTRGVQKVLQLDHKGEWKCYKPHFIFQYNPY